MTAVVGLNVDANTPISLHHLSTVTTVMGKWGGIFGNHAAESPVHVFQEMSMKEA